VIFFKILAYNALVIWMVLNPDWNRGKLQSRQLFLEELGKAFVRPQIQRRQHDPRTPASAAIVWRIQENQLLQYPEVSVSDVLALIISIKYCM
jgi:hypothetical protein